MLVIAVITAAKRATTLRNSCKRREGRDDRVIVRRGVIVMRRTVVRVTIADVRLLVVPPAVIITDALLLGVALTVMVLPEVALPIVLLPRVVLTTALGATPTSMLRRVALITTPPVQEVVTPHADRTSASHRRR